MDRSILTQNFQNEPKIFNNTSVLIIIGGATATGKSGLAIELADRMSSIILSADSRQVYREFTIGTAKPTLQEQNRIPHFLIDICDPTETLTVADYQMRVQEVLDRGGVQFLVGGTGLYIKAIARGMKIPRVAPQQELRSQLEQLGQKTLYEMLRQVDAIAASRIHANDQVRTLRALEVFYVTGRPISEQQGEEPPNFPILYLALDSDRLEQRIAKRTGQMLEMGFVEEVKTLCEKYGEALPLLNTLGYAEMRQYLRSEISLSEAERLTVLHTRQFAKRQRTWFRAVSEIEWFDSDAADLVDRVWLRVQEFYKAI
ncbi:tRNA (adenosine(37)-N6)-dimethylallyltransferase MiaA [Leptolyngbya sp. NIES-2104]|uniref:tRNA (adenosine(37)-N6)-dimethylallyltransferase MiaA n=1 Tax=Leptolyngbya sp. NIES-2104 TaxID=1552121 RepID=UPI0006EC799C|nr:tRNA (adenosine(37)-N6)-dimethylallyltransferase MiaA [Leptolyngbya sp. NIES-2104]GAP98445.1 tRNA dimethylallyltransferase [Leptolyngbya sp. NIES-2104]